MATHLTTVADVASALFMNPRCCFEVCRWADVQRAAVRETQRGCGTMLDPAASGFVLASERSLYDLHARGTSADTNSSSTMTTTPRILPTNSQTRRYVKIGLLAFVLLLLIHLGFRLSSFIHIFFTHAGVALTQDEVLAAYNALDHDARQQPVVPRIIHQIFHNWTHPAEETLPLDWQASRQTCLDLNQGWEHKLWTGRMSREFLEREYPWFLATYDNFQFPVQKIDALRYFLMRHYGGIYIDLDNVRNATRDSVRRALMGRRRVVNVSSSHCAFTRLGPQTAGMEPSATTYSAPPRTILSGYATGQWFLTKMWEEYHGQLSPQTTVLTRVMMDGRPEGAPWVFFNHSRGGTWDNWDNRMFGWIGQNLILFTLLLTATLAAVSAARPKLGDSRWGLQCREDPDASSIEGAESRSHAVVTPSPGLEEWVPQAAESPAPPARPHAIRSSAMTGVPVRIDSGCLIFPAILCRSRARVDAAPRFDGIARFGLKLPYLTVLRPQLRPPPLPSSPLRSRACIDESRMVSFSSHSHHEPTPSGRRPHPRNRAAGHLWRRIARHNPLDIGSQRRALPSSVTSAS
nr:mannosyl phosphorylinositol ceramide synthase sur1 [Quercus suber]